jgi:hypothetical protein
MSFELITYAKTDHDFVKGGAHFNSNSCSDAVQRIAAKLKEFLGNEGLQKTTRPRKIPGPRFNLVHSAG